MKTLLVLLVAIPVIATTTNVYILLGAIMLASVANTYYRGR